jgi:opacity protein-like surface antigen
MAPAVLTAALLLAVPAPAAAQTSDEPPAVSIRGFVDVAYMTFQADQTFDAIFGESSGPLFGGGGEVGFGPGIFVRVSVRRFEKDGERALVFNNEVFRLGIPLTVTMVPVEVTGGYRFMRRSRLVPYAGGGIGSVSYKEESGFAEPGENVDERFTSYHVLGGIEYRIARWIAVAFDAQYTRVPDSIGQGGLSQEFREDDLGGTSVHLKFIVGR